MSRGKGVGVLIPTITAPTQLVPAVQTVERLGFDEVWEAKAKNMVRQSLALYLEAVGPTALTGVYGANDLLLELLEIGGSEAIAAEMPDEWIENFAVAGNPKSCAPKIRALRGAGASSVVLVHMPADDARQALERAAETVLPPLDGES